MTLLPVIKAAQNLGFALDEVAELLATGEHRHGSRADPGLQARAAAKIAQIEAKIKDLAVIRDSLQQAVAAGCDGPIACVGSTCCPIPFTDLFRSKGHPDADR